MNMATLLEGPNSTNQDLIDRLQEFIQYTEVKRLVDNLQTLKQQNNFRNLAVLSCFAGEGKTLLCAATAMAYAKSTHQRVLIVDTSTRSHSRSLRLSQCFEPTSDWIDIVCLEDARKATNESHSEAEEPPKVYATPFPISINGDSDQAIVRQVTHGGERLYGLILLDTAPLTAQNKSNFDPLLIARAADASVLVVSRHLLQAPDLAEQLKVLSDPSLHLLGIVGNEEFSV